MTTWTLQQLSQARSLYVRVCLDTSHPARIDIRAAAAGKMARALTQEAHAFAIEMHQDDLAVKWSPDDDKPWQEWGEMRWHPATREVELRGGHRDGDRLEIQRVGEPIRTAVMMPFNPYEVASEPEPLMPTTVTYELDGWLEQERVWVYAAK